MDQDKFIDTYFKLIAKRFMQIGYNPDALVKAILTGTEMMIKNSGEMTNEKRFWETFSKVFEADYDTINKEFNDFYINEFIITKQTTQTNPLAKKCIDMLKEKGYNLVLTTNPLFPRIATEQRLEWAGLNVEDFIHITTYENSSFSKPNIQYYQSVLEIINKKPEECIMVGNDVREDMGVVELNIKTLLLTENLINKDNVDITPFNPIDFDGLYNYITKLPKLNND